MAMILFIALPITIEHFDVLLVIACIIDALHVHVLVAGLGACYATPRPMVLHGGRMNATM